MKKIFIGSFMGRDVYGNNEALNTIEWYKKQLNNEISKNSELEYKLSLAQHCGVTFFGIHL